MAWSSELQDAQTLPEDLRPVKREDWQKHEAQESEVPDSQEVWALVSAEQVRPHCGNELEAAEGRMLADRAVRANVKSRIDRRSMVCVKSEERK